MSFATQQLNKRFEGVHAVNDVSFELQPGKITGIIGPNGSGKTTVVNLLTGMIPWDKGVVLCESKKLQRLKLRDVFTNNIARTFQNIQLIEQVSVWDNLVLALQQRSVQSAFFCRLPKGVKERAEDLLKKNGLWDRRNELAMNLSYGERKMLEIARVLALDAHVIFFDEPFAGLSAETTRKMEAVLQELREQNKIIVLIEHNMTIIRDLSDYVLFMDEGVLIAHGEPEEVFHLPIVLEAYLGEKRGRS